MSPLYTPRTTEHVYLNNVDITDDCIGYSIPNSGALIYIYLRDGRHVRAAERKHYRVFVYGKLRIVKPDEL